MLDIGGRVIFLTGAPLPSSLRWTDEELCAPLQPCFIERVPGDITGISTIDDKAPSWRSLPLDNPHLPTGLTQLSREYLSFDDFGHTNEETSFLSTTELSFASTDRDGYPSERSQLSDSDKEDVFSQYYEHSFALHETIPSSQIVGADSSDNSFTTDLESFTVFLSPTSQPHAEDQLLTRSRLTSSHLADLKDMPNAAYLRSITPQTMTINLVVGIISISQPRTIKTRKFGHSVDLVEMLVGDDTTAGFGINIWLLAPPFSRHQNGTHAAQQKDNDLRAQTTHLRPQDVILAKTVALSSFRGKVYGQSLRRGMTTLDLLYRNVVDGDDARGAFCAAELDHDDNNNKNNTAANGASPQIRKVRDVKDWVMRFVGTTTTTTAGALPEGHISKSRIAKNKDGCEKHQMPALPNDTPQK